MVLFKDAEAGVAGTVYSTEWKTGKITLACRKIKYSAKVYLMYHQYGPGEYCESAKT